MRRMMNENTVLKKPQLYFEDELFNVSEITIDLEPGLYQIELHQRNSNSVAFLCVSEELNATSNYVQFNPGVSGTSPGYYDYYKPGSLIEIKNPQENIITVSGHIDIYKF